MKDKKVYWIIGMILAALLILKTPLCYFPEEQPDFRDVVEEDIKITQEKLEEKGSMNKYLVGMSMYPTLKSSQICYCEKAEDYKVGDIVSYFAYLNGDPTFIMHRIVEVLPSGDFVTKGDNNMKVDPFVVKKSQVFCRLKEVSYLEYYLLGGKFNEY